MIEVHYTVKKETKNMIRFEESPNGRKYIVTGDLYVSKAALAEIGNSGGAKGLTVTFDQTEA